MYRFFSALLLIALAAPSYSQVSDDLASTYLEATGLPTQAEQVGSQMAQQIQAQVAQLPAPAREPFREIYANAFEAENLTVRVEDYVEENGEPEAVREAIDWFEDPLVVRMQELEEEASADDEVQVAMQMYAMTGSFNDYTPTPEREEQVGAYLAATNSVENNLELYLDIIAASAMSMAALRAEGEQPDPDEIRAQMRPQLEAMLPNMIRANALYTFKDVSDADFTAYVGQLESPAAQYGVALNAAALRNAFVGAITNAGERFVVELQKLDAAGEIDLDAMRAEAEARAAQQRQMQQSAPMEDDSDMDDSMMEDDQ